MAVKNQRTTGADLEPAAHFDAGLLETGDLFQQVVHIQHDAIADVAFDTLADNAGRHQIELVFALCGTLPDHQRMTGIMAALKTHHALGVVGQPVYDLALALIAPLGAYDYNILHHDLPDTCLI